MGYSTDFVGQFDCYRAENNQIRAFLTAVRDGDMAAVAALVDWLSEHEDPRGERIGSMVVKNTLVLPSFWQLFGLKTEHAAYLKQFSRTRRMRRDPKQLKQLPDPLREAVGLPLGQEGAYFVAGVDNWPRDRDASVLDYNQPPKGQPGLWCKWAPNELGTAIVWNRAEKFYDYVKWLKYLIKHF
jgi:hypothetical protein